MNQYRAIKISYHLTPYLLTLILFAGLVFSQTALASGWHCPWGSDLTTITTQNGKQETVCLAPYKPTVGCPQGTSFMPDHNNDNGKHIGQRCQGPAFYR